MGVFIVIGLLAALIVCGIVTVILCTVYKNKPTKDGKIIPDGKFLSVQAAVVCSATSGAMSISIRQNDFRSLFGHIILSVIIGVLFVCAFAAAIVISGRRKKHREKE